MKSFVAILIISAFAYQALAQVGTCTTANTNCANCPASAGLSASLSSTVIATANLSNFCVACASGFLLAPNTACALITNTGCVWGPTATTCFAGGCTTGYIYYAATTSCVPCAATTATTGITLQTAGIATCSISSTGAITALTCMSGYVLAGTTCFSCTGTTAATPSGGSSVIGIPNCATCTTTAAVGTGTGTPNYVTCSACAWGYSLYPVTLAGKPGPTSSTGSAQTAPFCFNTTSTITAANLAAISTVIIGGVINLVGAITADTGCANFALVVPTSASASFLSQFCTAPLAGYLCATANAAGASCYAISTAALTSTSGGLGCASGMTAASVSTTPIVSTTAATCWSCITGYQWIASAPTTCNTVGSCAGTCVANVTGCAVLSAAAVCATASPGYTVSSAGVVSACTATGTACTGGPMTGFVVYANGSYIAGTGVSNCWLSNSTSNCLLCAANYATAAPTCTTACPSNCNICSSTTTCTSCKTGFTAGTSGTCTATASTSNSNVLLSGLAFVSMIFYYIF